MSAGGPLSLDELAALAAQALEQLPGEGLVDVLAEHGRLAVVVTAVQDGRAARAVADGTDGVHLARAAKAASVRARQARAWPAPPLPRAHDVPATRHEGTIAPEQLVPDVDGIPVTWDTGVARMAVAATTGLLAVEERSHAVARLGAHHPDGRSAAVTVAGVGSPGGRSGDRNVTPPCVGEGELAVAAAEVRALVGEGEDAGPFAPRMPAEEGAVPDDARTVVLGPEAVAAVLDQLRSAFGVDLALGGGPFAGRLDQRAAADGVTLGDDASHPRTLPRRYDAEGVPRRAVPLIDRGFLAGQVHDSASAGPASTGHATRPLTLAPHPDHLVLDGGTADGVAALLDGIEDGLVVPALGAVVDRVDGGRCHRVTGAARVRGGRVAGWLPPLTLEVRALDVLAATDGLTAAQRLVPLRGQCPGGVGAAVVPALRATDGIRFA